MCQLWACAGIKPACILPSGEFDIRSGSDPTAALSGIDGLVGNPCTMHPDWHDLDLCPGDRFGNLGRNVLRGDGIGNLDLSVSKTTRLAESHALQFWRGVPNRKWYASQKGDIGASKEVVLFHSLER